MKAILEDANRIGVRQAFTEPETLTLVMGKMSALVSIFIEANVDPDEIDELDDESKGWFMEVQAKNGGASGSRTPSKATLATRSPEEQADTRKLSIELVADQSLCPKLDRWDFNLLGMAAEELDKVMIHVFLHSSIGQKLGHIDAGSEVLCAFIKEVRAGYLENPYHNYTHACEVTACTFKLLREIQWNRSLSECDVYALLLSATCHDIGHPGRTNQFLIETKDRLAVQYNDRSPLENMHCSKLFEISNKPSTDVFCKLDKEGFKQARGICIGAILHTDNAMHFDMVKEIAKVHEVCSSYCSLQYPDPETYVDDYVTAVLEKNLQLWLKVFLHLADVANPFKPFELYRLWATHVTDEFFQQGDEEKRLGIPVGMLNDRDKVSRSGCEHGFITFLVAPFCNNVVRCFPTLHHLARQMGTNIEEWRHVWVK